MDADEARDTSRALRQKTSICIEPFQTPSLDLSEEKAESDTATRRTLAHRRGLSRAFDGFRTVNIEEAEK